MMINQLTLKQKIIGGMVLGIIIVAIAICLIVFLPQEDDVLDLNQLIRNSEENTNENAEEVKQEEIKKIVVHITGEVKNAGIITLEEGARIVDAIKEAGGATNEADLNEVNLAYELQDGQKIYIPNKKDKQKNEGQTYITSESGNNVIKSQENETKGGNKKVNINQATQSELETLPGIGPSIASRIIEYREQNGNFQKIEDLQNVKGIGDAKYANIKDHVTVK